MNQPEGFSKDLWIDQKIFNDKVMRHYNADPDNLTDEEKIAWLQYYVHAMHKEVEELDDLLPWKKHKQGFPVDYDEFKEEWIDVLKFWMNVGIVAGFSYYDIPVEYRRKSAIVEDKWNNFLEQAKESSSQQQISKNSSDESKVPNGSWSTLKLADWMSDVRIKYLVSELAKAIGSSSSTTKQPPQS